MSNILWGPCKVAARGASLEKNKEMAMVLCKYLNKGEPLTDVLQIFCVNIPPLRETAPDLNFETSCQFWQIIDLRRGHAETHGKDDERWKK